MKLKYFYAVLLVVLAVVVVRAFWPSGPARTLPQHFELSERVLWKLTTTLDAQAGGDNLGTVSAEMLSLTRSFVFKDNTGAVAATGSVGMFTWGTQINMVDRSGKAIGAIKEEVFSSVFKTYTTYQVLDASGQAIATSEKLEFLSTDILLKSSSGVVMAELHRSWFRLFGDRWTVDIRDPRVDPRLTLMIAAFKTGADNDGAESGGSNSTTKPGSKK